MAQGAAVRIPMNANEQHLKILSICYYVLGAIVGLLGFLPIIHVSIGFMMVFAPEKMGGGPNPPPVAIGWLFIILGGVAMLFSWAMAIAMILTGRYLARRRNYIFCLVVGGLICMNVPLGTVLGVFTIIILVKPEVKAMFERRADSDIPSTAIQPDYEG